MFLATVSAFPYWRCIWYYCPHIVVDQHPPAERTKETLIVKGLSSKITEEAIKTAFSAYGQVNQCKVVDQYDARLKTGKFYVFSLLSKQQANVDSYGCKRTWLVFFNNQLCIDL